MEKAEIKPAVVQVEAHPYYPQAELKSYLDTFAQRSWHGILWDMATWQENACVWMWAAAPSNTR